MTLKFFSGHWWDGDAWWDGKGWCDGASFDPCDGSDSRAARPADWTRDESQSGGRRRGIGRRDGPDCPVPCFTPGALVTTARGTLPIEALRPGDWVVTRDNGLQPVVWIGENFIGPDRLEATPDLRPIRIRAGSLGGDLPGQDVVVSPQHRILCSGEKAQTLFGEPEVLVPARHLTALPGISAETVSAVTYLHLMFDRHQVVMADGVWSESFQPGDWMVDAMDGAQRAEILAIFPELADRPAAEVYPAARRGLLRHEAMLYVA